MIAAINLTLDGAGANQRRSDSKGDEMNNVICTYIGSGCFIDTDGYLAFVNKSNRPAFLVEGKAYRLVMQKIDHGALYYVQGEAGE